MKTIISQFIFTFIIGLFLANGQEVNLKYDHIQNVNQYMSEYHHLKRSETGMIVLEYEDIEGTAFMNEFFVPGQIVMKDDDVFEGPLRFNMYTEQVEFQTPDGSVFEVYNPKKISKIWLDEKKFVYVLEPGNPANSIFMEELVEGEVSLFLRRSVKFHEATAAQPYVQPKPARFDRNKDRYYILEKDDVYFEEIGSKRSLLKALEDKKSELKKFIKENNLDTNKPRDLRKIVEFYNEG